MRVCRPLRGCAGHNDAVELKQLRAFIRVVELASITRAADDLAMTQSALSQQMSRLESELATRLLSRNSRGVVATDAGIAFLREAQLTLRHADQAVRAAQHKRLSGTVSLGLPPTTASLLGAPVLRAMSQGYPDVRLHLVEGLSGHLSTMLNGRQLDLAVLTDTPAGRRWSQIPLVSEQLFLMQAAQRPMLEARDMVTLSEVALLPLILPTESHGLRSALNTAFRAAGFEARIGAEIDSLPLLMEAVEQGLGCTLQPWSALGRYPDAAQRFQWHELRDPSAQRTSTLCSVSDDELSPAGLAARNVVATCAAELVNSGLWRGAQIGTTQPSIGLMPP